ncbi:MAG: DUF167 domain-containing protein [Nitrospirae bacterium]|nr:MAG: DUF167 domain-containing protein [Nitrospirota bacterium]
MAGKAAARPQATLSVRVQPRASRNEVAGLVGDQLKIKLTAPPVEGEANDACLKFLADLLDLAPSRLEILRGEHSRTKLIRITGLTQAEVTALLAKNV